jgi:hypothetical protein
MKRLFYFSAILLAITLNGCKKDKDGIAYSADYQKSFHAWHDFKTKSGDSYVYQLETSSWIGYSSETTITVKQGKIIERSFALKGRLSNSSAITVMREWKEDETQLGTHTDAHPLYTLDDIYEKAKTEWLLERGDAKTYFEAANDGMISVCGFTRNGCADDCFNGVHIVYISAL